MVSVLPAPAGHVQNPELALYYHHHVSRLSNSSKNIHHLRSQSMPEAVYIQQQQAAAAAAVSAFKPPRVRHPSGHHQPTAPNAVQMVSLRRSHTNVADFARPKGFTRSSRYWNESGCDVNSTNGGLYLARSRSNIAALGLNPEAVYRPSNQYHVVHHHGLPAQGSSSVGISRAASFYHHRDHRPMQTARSLGFLANSRSSLALPTSMNSCKDLSQPLHVDCSVEYDLGNQPKIPKDSAPLLIIHPAYQQEQLHVGPSSSSTATATSRFHPYNTSTSMISPSALEELDHKSKGSSGHGTSLASSSLSSTSSKTSNNRLPPGQRYPPQTAHHRVQPHQRPSIARHSSFLVTSPPRMVALVKGDRGHGGGQINRRSSFMEAGGRSLFHLSMPDIVIAEDAKFEHQRKQKLTMSAQQPQKPQQRFTHNKKAQHRHGHMVNSKARLNLNAKLEAVRKLSSGSASSTTHCDSGLGTPISLMDEVSSSSMTGGSSSASQNSGSSHLSKWRSSMSGKKKNNPLSHLLLQKSDSIARLKYRREFTYYSFENTSPFLPIRKAFLS